MKRVISLVILAATLAVGQQSSAAGFQSSTYLINTPFLSFLKGSGVGESRPYIEVFIVDQGLHPDGYRVDVTYISMQDGVTRHATHDVAATSPAILDIYWFDASSASATVTPYRLIHAD